MEYAKTAATEAKAILLTGSDDPEHHNGDDDHDDAALSCARQFGRASKPIAFR